MTSPSSSESPKDAPAFDFYPERWTHGTRHMSKVERCDYLDLLVFQWTEQGLPGDLGAVARILGYKKASQIPAAVLEKFPVCADGKRRNARLETVRQEQRERIARRRNGALKTNAARWGTGSRERVGSDIASDSADGIVSESPPPTTHHPPRSIPSPSAAGAGVRAVPAAVCVAAEPRPGLDHARDAAGHVGVTTQEAEEWWHAREASGWLKGTAGGAAIPVGVNWRADLKAYTNRARERRAQAAARGRVAPVGARVESANPGRF